jgi:ubiquinone/menaquinone biosynthesis C-methylase UbiE
VFEEYKVPLTPFVTHDSAMVRSRFGQPGSYERVGLHPNFQLQSTHGVNETEVLEAVTGIWPQARGFRCHGYYDSSHLTVAARERGLEWDSNLALFLQPCLLPLEHFSGLVRFPSWWDDDTHLGKGFTPHVTCLSAHLLTPGLKLMNFHPIHVALNSPSLDHNAATKSDLAASYEGRGVRTLLIEILEFIREHELSAAYLHDLFLEHDAEDEGARELRARRYRPGQRLASRAEANADSYRVADNATRAAAVQAEYDRREARNRYATSRDVNLRELEIGFIREHLSEGRILDLGCGNGHTLLSLAHAQRGEMVGLDFSAALIEGAEALLADSHDLKASVTFEQGDVRELPYGDAMFDFAISERCLLNLPSREDQWRTLREIHRVLRPGGVYVMVEGTEDGLNRLNNVRTAVGLDPIPSVSDDNFSSLKFDEEELRRQLEGQFAIDQIRYFSAYYTVTRVVQPLLALPRSPSFAASINQSARVIDEAMPDAGRLGHVFGLKLIAHT